VLYDIAMVWLQGAGKVLPMFRGGGIDQKALLDIGRKVAKGDWIHVFPEAGSNTTNHILINDDLMN
jgi:monolysocardiolipin acyltransferase